MKNANAIRILNEKMLDDREIKVNIAKPREERPQNTITPDGGKLEYQNLQCQRSVQRCPGDLCKPNGVTTMADKISLPSKTSKATKKTIAQRPAQARAADEARGP